MFSNPREWCGRTGYLDLLFKLALKAKTALCQKKRSFSRHGLSTIPKATGKYTILCTGPMVTNPTNVNREKWLPCMHIRRLWAQPRWRAMN